MKAEDVRNVKEPDLEKLVTVLEKAYLLLDPDDFKNIVIPLGSTGAGKTTFVANYVYGNILQKSEIITEIKTKRVTKKKKKEVIDYMD